MPLHGGKDRVRNFPDSDLKRGSVRDERRDVFSDRPIGVTEFGARRLWEGRVNFHGGVDARDVERRVSERHGHVWVDLGDNDAGVVHGRSRARYGKTQAAKPVNVRRRHLDERHVDPERPVRDESWNVRQKDRRKVRVARGDGFPRVGSNEERLVAQMTFACGSQVRRIALGMEVDDFHVSQLHRTGRQSLEEGLGRHRRLVDVDAVSGPNQLDGLGGGCRVHVK